MVVEGKVSLATIEALSRELQGHPDYVKGLNTYWDLRQADISHLDREFFEQVIARFVLKYGRPDRAVAYVVADDLSYGIMRMFEARARLSVEQNYKVFKDVDEAASWLERFNRLPA